MKRTGLQLTNLLPPAVTRAIAGILSFVLVMPSLPAQSPNPDDYRIKVTSDLVLTNVVVRDKQGNLVRGLKQEDFTVYEDGKAQHLVSFDFENVDALATAGEGGLTVSGSAAPVKIIGTQQPVKKEELKNHRLIVLFFDFGAMEPDDIDRAVSAAQKYVKQQMAPADLVAVISLASSMDRFRIWNRFDMLSQSAGRRSNARIDQTDGGRNALAD